MSGDVGLHGPAKWQSTNDDIVRGDSLLKLVLEGRMKGKRPRGRLRIGMIDELKEGSYVNMKRRAEDREKWRCWMPRTCRRAENL